MKNGKITIKEFTKIEGCGGLTVTVTDDEVSDVKLRYQDFRRFYPSVAKGRDLNGIPQMMSRICGTCSVSHLLASIQAIEKSQGIEVTEQTKVLRRLAYDGLILRDHPLHLYFFVLPDMLGVDSIFDVSDDPDDFGYILLHDSFIMKQLGTDISTAIMGAPVHAPNHVIGGLSPLPDPSKFPEFIERLEAVRPLVIRGVKAFFDWKVDFNRDYQFMCIRDDKRFNFLEGNLIDNNKKKRPQEDYFDKVVTRYTNEYSQTEGYELTDEKREYTVGAIARLNNNLDQLHPRTKKDLEEYLGFFPSNNIYDNNLAQMIETLHCVDEAIDIMKEIKIKPEKPVEFTPHAGRGVCLLEAPRGILCHTVDVGENGKVADYWVSAPSAPNQKSMEEDMKQLFTEQYHNLSEDELKHQAEMIIRAYDPCISCSTNFLKVDFVRT